MHRSRLSTVLVDCDPESFERGVQFWSGALGKAAIPMEDPRYVSLKGRVGGDGGLYVALQRVPGEERGMHIDIETDDIEREITRLRRLGATIKARIRGHVVMCSPSGHPFCVVPVYRPDFEANATVWNDED
jgi:predicted enzyme related to lactoylglutathione lyase